MSNITKNTTFEEYARTELISILSWIHPNNETVFLNSLINAIRYSQPTMTFNERFKLLSNDNIRKGLAVFYKANPNSLSKRGSDDIYDILIGSYLDIKITDALMVILTRNIMSLYNKDDDDFTLVFNKETIEFIKSGLSKKSFIF